MCCPPKRSANRGAASVARVIPNSSAGDAHATLDTPLDTSRLASGSATAKLAPAMQHQRQRIECTRHAQFQRLPAKTVSPSPISPRRRRHAIAE